jgi:hypothetical protein
MTRFLRLFRPLDTSRVDAALGRAEQAQHDLTVRTRAIRMDVACERPRRALEQLIGYISPIPPTGIPADMQALLDRMP